MGSTKQPEAKSTAEIYGTKPTDPLVVSPEDLAEELASEPEPGEAEPEPEPEQPFTDGPGSESEGQRFDGLELEAETLMLILDTGMGMAAGTLAGDVTRYERFTLATGRRKTLAGLLEQIMAKWTQRFEPETYFVGLMLVSYAPLLLAAYRERQTKAKAERVEIIEDAQEE